MRRLHGKVAIVTGGGQGVGEGISLRLAEEEAEVVIADAREEAGECVAADIRAAGGSAVAIQADVTSGESVVALMGSVVERFGRIDVLCNNAGVGHLRSILEEDDAGYDRIMDVNVRGIYHCCKHALPAMLEQGSGSIVNVGSVASFVGFPRDTVYCASKGAVIMLTKQLALEYAASGVRVNAVCPGFIETPDFRRYVAESGDPESAFAEVVALHPMGRIGKPKEIADGVVYLASDESSFVTGLPLVIDGGLLTR
jgi:NAD(P)-dependent dehydrogenase (short-subunit alcohol dehydrogenase family)